MIALPTVFLVTLYDIYNQCNWIFSFDTFTRKKLHLGNYLKFKV